MDDTFIGTSANASADTDLLKKAGIGWVRQDFNYVERLKG